MTARIRLVYLLAASHSGSTLLAMLLGTHPDICTVGELKLTSLGDIDQYRCGCGVRIRECAFWADVTARLRAQGVPFDLSRSCTDFAAGAPPGARRLLSPLQRARAAERVRDLLLSLVPGWRAHLARTQHANAALAASVLDVTERRVLVDSSKIGSRLKYLLRNPAFDVKVVRLVRDGRAVALTYMDPAGFADARRPELRGGGHGGSRDAERLPMRLAAREWRRANEEAEAIVGGLPQAQYMEARYEDLCVRPDEVLSRIFEFIGVPRMTTDDLRAAARQRHVVGNGMRLDWDGSIRLDERWRQALDGVALSEFEAAAGALNRRLGYR